MDELDQTQETILAECLEAIDAGADIEVCLARYPEHAQALRLYLELRTQLLTLGRQPEPPAEAYRAGRLTLLKQVSTPPSKTTGRALVHAFGLRWGLFEEQMRAFAAGGWDRLGSPLARVAAVGALLLLVGGGALGASAAAGFDPAREVLSALHIVDQRSDSEERNANADEGVDNADDGIGNAGVDDTGQRVPEELLQWIPELSQYDIPECQNGPNEADEAPLEPSPPSDPLDGFVPDETPITSDPSDGFVPDETPIPSDPLDGFVPDETPIPSEPVGDFVPEETPIPSDPVGDFVPEGLADQERPSEP